MIRIYSDKYAIELVKELHESVIKKFESRKVYARFNDNIWTADLAETTSLSSKT